MWRLLESPDIVEEMFTGLVGRDPEIRLLHAAAERVRNGSRSAIVIEGDAGIGKSSLASEFAARYCPDWPTLRLRCAEPDMERPLIPVIDGLRTLMADLRSAGKAVPAELLDAVDQFRVSSRLDRTDDGQSGDRIVALIVEGLAELSERTPILVAFDDIQWIDDVSAHLLWSLTRSPRGGGVLVIACTRPTSRESVVALRRALDARGVVTTIVSPLSNEDSETLALRFVDAVDATIRDMLRDAGGNPFFITELLRGLEVARGVEPDASGESIPLSLRRIVMGRLLGWPELSITLLLDAALLGESFEVADLCLVHSLNPTEVIAGLEVALHEQVLVGSGERLRFQHALVQTIVAESRSDPIRRVRHREIAERLGHGNRPATQVAEHHWKSTPYQSDKARESLRRASKEVRTLSLDSALVWAERARSCANDRTEQFADQLDIAELLLLRGHLTEAETICRSAGLAPTDPAEEQRLRSVLLALTTMAGRTRHAEALEHVEWILAQYGEGEPMWVELMSSKAALLLMSGELESSIEIAHEALQKNRPTNPSFVVSRTFECLGVNAMLLGHVGESLAFTQRALDTFDFQRNLLSGVMTPHFGRSLTMLSSRPIQEVEATLQAGIRECDRAGHGLARLHLQPFHALTHFVRGDLATAQACVDSILAQNSDWRQTNPSADASHSNERRNGRRESDRTLSTPAGRRRVVDGTASGVSLPTVTGLAAYLALMQDDMTNAVILADRTILELLQGGAQAATADFAVWCAAGVYEAHGDPTKARDLLLMIWELMAKEASLYTIAPDVVRLTVDSHPDVAAEVTALADARFERSGAVLDRAHAFACRGFLNGDPKRLKQAAECWESLGWLVSPTRIREFALDFSDSVSTEKDPKDVKTVKDLRDAADVELVRSYWSRMEAVRPLRLMEAAHPRVTQRGRKAKERTQTLSQTERMVALLVAEGLTNKEIAERLFISYRTVDTHVSHSLSKLGFNSRVQLAGFVVSEL
jgi:DNA-binding CsgD family transcriptional regulator